jgi:hypothetical protein
MLFSAVLNTAQTLGVAHTDAGADDGGDERTEQWPRVRGE